MAPTRKPPPLILPLCYLAAGHVALVIALLTAAIEPDSLAGFFLHPRLLAVVHLITLGWITLSILGALYLVMPVALRADLPVGPLDIAIFICTIIGASGVISHFWIDLYPGIDSSGGLLVLAFLVLGARVFLALRRSPAPAAVRAHIVFAFFNLILASVMGILVALNKSDPFLPGSRLQTVFGHAHLGLVGFATLMVVGIGHRLLPMYLPAGPRSGWTLWLSVALFQTGTIGLWASYLWAPAYGKWFALAIAGGVVLFCLHVIRMRLDPRPPPKKMPRPDVGMLHAFQAIAYLLFSTGIGVFLAWSPGWHIGWAMAYGVCALLGFFGQIIVGIAMRLLPMTTWLNAWTASEFQQLPRSPHEMPVRALQWISLVTWSAGVPMTAFGLASGRLTWLSAGAWVLLAGLLAATGSAICVVMQAKPARAASAA
ncbi:MAG: hypothetical protein V3T86_07320 [Planctomycetota bacterium]